MVENAKESSEFSLFNGCMMFLWNYCLYLLLWDFQWGLIYPYYWTYMDHIDLFEFREGKETFNLFSVVVHIAGDVFLDRTIRDFFDECLAEGLKE